MIRYDYYVAIVGVLFVGIRYVVLCTHLICSYSLDCYRCITALRWTIPVVDGAIWVPDCYPLMLVGRSPLHDCDLRYYLIGDAVGDLPLRCWFDLICHTYVTLWLPLILRVGVVVV